MKTILITGSTDGIGKQTAYELASLGHQIIVHGRNSTRVDETVADLQSKTQNMNIRGVVGDLALMNNVYALGEMLAAQFPAIDVLINNAGVYMHSKVTTKDGFEVTFAVNHLAPFLLTYQLLPVLLKSDEARIINVSSVAHERGTLDFDNLNAEKKFSAYGSYALSKLANVLFTVELAKKIRTGSLTVNALHPGVIGTKLLKSGFGIDGASLEMGAQTSVYLAVSPEVRSVNGKYFTDCKRKAYNPVADDSAMREKFWYLSEMMAGINYPTEIKK